MKKIIFRAFVAIAAVVLSMGCQSEGQKYLEQIVGDWHYNGAENGVQEDVWIVFSQDMTFELYQKVGDGVHRSITGRYSINADKKIISGMYEDNYPWKYDYKFEVKGNNLVLTAVSDTYSVTYTRGIVPAEVRQMSLPLVKSVSAELPRCL